MFTLVGNYALVATLIYDTCQKTLQNQLFRDLPSKNIEKVSFANFTSFSSYFGNYGMVAPGSKIVEKAGKAGFLHVCW